MHINIYEISAQPKVQEIKTLSEIYQRDLQNPLK